MKTSFVLIVPEKIHDKVLTEINDGFSLAIINKFANNDLKDSNGVIVFFDSDDSWDNFITPEDYGDYDEDEYPYKAFEDYKKIIRIKLKGKNHEN